MLVVLETRNLAVHHLPGLVPPPDRERIEVERFGLETLTLLDRERPALELEGEDRGRRQLGYVVRIGGH